MLYTKLHCHRCGGNFEQYLGTLTLAAEDGGIRCPFCRASVPTDAAAALLDAYNRLERANEQMRPAFTAEIRSYRAEGRR